MHINSLLYKCLPQCNIMVHICLGPILWSRAVAQGNPCSFNSTSLIFIMGKGLEKISCKLWLNKALEYNNYYLFFSTKWFIPFIQVIKKELFLSNNILVDQSATDMLQLDNQEDRKWFFFFSRLQIYYNFYFFFIKARITLLLNTTNSQKQTLASIDRYYSNANWLERESSEMYGLFFFFKNDTRKLLLDYSKIENPMLKDFPSEGLTDVFYNFFYNQVITNKNEVVEL